MLESYQKMLEKAKNKSGENKKFLEKLKQKKPADLDLLTHTLHDKAFENINEAINQNKNLINEYESQIK